ncbi:MAG TPA: glycogen/starch synthase [Patescibacteria group bacterium]|nr:glycogen/starch synthase [Patescibacteria group bacterium]
MKILFLGAEVGPYASVGGLSQVLYFLPRALQQKGHDVRIFTARHGTMDTTGPGKKEWKLKPEIKNIKVPVYNTIQNEPIKGKPLFINCSVSSYSKAKAPKAYFLENKEYFTLRAHVFGYKDDHVRFALLSKGCLEWLLKLKEDNDDDWWPDVIHTNDWHTGYFVDLARNDKRYKSLLNKTPITFTVHNFYFQGNINFRYLAPKDRDTGVAPLAALNSTKLLKQNALLRGIINADEVNTVSPSHAIEVLTPEYAEGLEKTLNKVRGKITGILNGLDTKEFNPMTDPIIKNNYNLKNFVTARQKNKLLLQKEFTLSQNPKRPLIAVCGRISAQKGWDLILKMLPKLLLERPDVQVLVMGQGDERFQNELSIIQRDFSEQLSLHLQTDFRLPRRINAGADMVLIPSIFEPGGIVALEAMRYGAIPIVRRTGGLNDIVTEFNPNTGEGNGFSFKNKSSWSLYGAIITALTIYGQPKLWTRLVSNALSSDFSWEHAAREYEVWYKGVIEERKRATSATPHPAYST